VTAFVTELPDYYNLLSGLSAKVSCCSRSYRFTIGNRFMTPMLMSWTTSSTRAITRAERSTFLAAPPDLADYRRRSRVLLPPYHKRARHVVVQTLPILRPADHRIADAQKKAGKNLPRVSAERATIANPLARWSDDDESQGTLAGCALPRRCFKCR